MKLKLQQVKIFLEELDILLAFLMKNQKMIFLMQFRLNGLR